MVDADDLIGGDSGAGELRLCAGGIERRIGKHDPCAVEGVAPGIEAVPEAHALDVAAGPEVHLPPWLILAGGHGHGAEARRRKCR